MTSAETKGTAADFELCSRRQLLRGGFWSAVLLLADVGLGCAGSSPSEEQPREPGAVTASGRPLAAAQATEDSRVPILWIEAGVCTGCEESLLASLEPTIEAALPLLRVEFQATLMDGLGASPIDGLLTLADELQDRYLLVVDGAIPYDATASMTTLGTTSDGVELTAQRLVGQLAAHAKAVIALGTCAAFGGIPSAAPNFGG